MSRLGDQADDRVLTQPFLHGTRTGLLDTDLSSIEVGDGSTHGEDAPRGIGMNQIRQGRDGLHFQLVGSLAIGVDTEIGILQQASDRPDQRGVTGGAFDVFDVKIGRPSIGSPKERKDGISGIF